MPIALFELLLAAEFLGVLVFKTNRRGDLLDDVLVRRGVIATGRFIPDEVRRLRVRVDITGGDSGVCLRQLVVQSTQVCPAGADRARGAIEVE